jgi:hypothetical protein
MVNARAVSAKQESWAKRCGRSKAVFGLAYSKNDYFSVSP